MYRLESEPPLGSCLVVDTDRLGQPRISWRLPGEGFDFWHEVGCLALTFCFWCSLLAVIIALIYDLSVRDGSTGLGCCHAFLLLWLAFGLAIVMKLWNGLRRPVPASIVLGTSDLKYDPGRRRSDNTDSWRWFGTPSARVVDCGQITKVQFDRLGERPRLSVDVGSQHLEIGGSLPAPELEWLAVVLRQWAGLESSRTAADENIKKWRST
jgi:hypothetical protein